MLKIATAPSQEGKSHVFRAVTLNKKDDGIISAVETLDDAALPQGDVLVAVEFSNMNYKDGLVLNGLGNLVKSYPHVPGIDLAGTVLESRSPEYRAGDKVVLTGWRVGELYWGGFAQKARVSASQLLPLPSNLSTKQAMIVGTAGLTAMLSVMELETQGLKPDQGAVLVTGATGGVGSVATAILAKLGYTVATSSGKDDMRQYLTDLGSSQIIAREELAAAGRPMESEKWAGCVDAVGGTTLARVLSQMKYGGSVAAVGLVGGAKLETTVVPFLLRGVKLIGIDSVLCPNAKRREAWRRIETDLPFDKLDSAVTTCGLSDVQEYGKKILEGRVRGRTLVDTNA
ncbi:MAG: oxidoreductase [Mesorhizobium sp.]|nr:MDR family oxidoreductase [Mesorhizobium sp.]MBL8575586.1 oxidoreductase [Mesorhizobium sp.]